jgi:WD40 repeat protein
MRYLGVFIGVGTSLLVQAGQPAVAQKPTVPASAAPAATPLLSERRVALVIGNGAYQHVPRLPNPSNDANDVAAALRRSGFNTIVRTNLDWNGMVDATIRFSRAARNADVALFYYSGHALQFNGVNYLTPVDADLVDESDLRRMTRVDEIVSALQEAKNLRILVLDSCRDNPLAEQLRRSVAATRALPLQRGLAKVDAPQGMIVAYATQAGQTADDGDGRNSPYTAAFLKHFEERDEIGSVFREVSEDVYENTKHRQLPELSLSIIGRFYLRGKFEVSIKPDNSSIPSPPVSTDTAHTDFEAAERVDTLVGWNAFLKQHPEGFYATLANERRSKLLSLALPPDRTSLSGSVDSQIASTPSIVLQPPKFDPANSLVDLTALREKYRGWALMPTPGYDRYLRSINALAISPKGDQIISGIGDNSVRVWDTVTGDLLRTMGGHILGVTAVSISSDGARIVSGGDDKVVRIWNARGDSLSTLYGHTLAVTAVAVSPDGGRIISGSADKTLKIWDAANGTLRFTLTGHSGGVNAVAYSADGLRIVSGSADNSVKIWDAQRGYLLRTLSDHTDRVRAVAVWPDGSRIVSAGDDKTVKIWDLASGNLLRTLSGHTNSVRAVAVWPDGTRIASASDDGTIKIWDATKDRAPTTLVGSTHDVISLAISPDGGRIVAGSSDATIKIWDTGKVDPSLSLIVNPKSTVVIRSDGSFWTNSDGLTQLSLVRGTFSQQIPSDYKAVFLREKPFEPGVASAK